jgi:transcriptional regulator with XRE-family HTH domain
MSGFQIVDGDRLRALRRERMLSQTELAVIVGTTQATVSALERGDRQAQPRTVRRLADVLGVEPAELVKK